jgi:hypothetical protein
VPDIGSVSSLGGCLLAVHDYSFFGSDSWTSDSQWVAQFQGEVGNYSDRTVCTEWGGPMSPGSKNGISYGSLDYDTSPTNYFEAYIQGMSSQLRAWNMGSFYWAGLKDGDWYSMTSRSGTGTSLALSVPNSSGLAQLQNAWPPPMPGSSDAGAGGSAEGGESDAVAGEGDAARDGATPGSSDAGAGGSTEGGESDAVAGEGDAARDGATGASAASGDASGGVADTGGTGASSGSTGGSIPADDSGRDGSGGTADGTSGGAAGSKGSSGGTTSGSSCAIGQASGGDLSGLVFLLGPLAFSALVRSRSGQRHRPAVK